MASGLAGYTDYYNETGQPLKRLVVRPEVAATVESGSANSLGPAETGEGNPFGDFLSRLSEALGKSNDNLLGLNGKERYQLWPERLVREGLSAAHDVMSGEKPAFTIDPVTGEAHTSPQMIEAGQAMSALAGTGGLGGVGAEAGTALGSGPFLRPALKYGEKLYKGKEGQQHLDLIPADLYPTFQKQAMNGDDISHWNFGFYNDKGHFLTRDKALQYGIDNGIIDPQSGKFGALTSTMMSDSSKPGAVIAANKPMFDFSAGQSSGSKSVKIRPTEITYGVNPKNNDVELSLIRTDKNARNQGNGRKVIEQFLSEADANNKRVLLNADPMDKSTNRNKLVNFYKSLGFERNKGTNKDFTTRAEFIRNPKSLSDSSQPAIATQTITNKDGKTFKLVPVEHNPFE